MTTVIGETMMKPFRLRVALLMVGVIRCMLGLDASDVCHAQSDQEPPRPLPLSTDYAGKETHRVLPTTVEWKGRTYDLDAGIDVLMGVVKDPTESPDEHGRALASLGMLDTLLVGRTCMTELQQLYDGVGDLEKGFILLCFLRSDDPRGIPLFTRVLDKEEDNRLRLRAIDGLIRWNIHRGVAELAGLLESKEMLPQPARMPYVRDNANHLFRIYNGRKGWGFPDEEVRKSLEKRSDLTPEQVREMYAQRIKKWWAENEQRFPEWKPGDPLPAKGVGDKDDVSKP